MDLNTFHRMLLTTDCNLEKICAELAKLFDVHRTEIGVLRLEGDFLSFVHPIELQAAGRIPLSGSAVAARTATSRNAELYNNFANVPHRSVFEMIRLKDPELKDVEPVRIQKLMSAPMLNQSGQVLGVVQVSRKGITPAAAGRDFTVEELDALERAARKLAVIRPQALLRTAPKSRWKFELHNEQKKRPQGKANTDSLVCPRTNRGT